MGQNQRGPQMPRDYPMPAREYQPPAKVSIPLGQKQTVGSGGTSDDPQQFQLASPLLNTTEPTKLRRKVYFPTNTGINYIGLLIGPKGMYQKKLEEQTGCKILIRGR